MYYRLTRAPDMPRTILPHTFVCIISEALMETAAGEGLPLLRYRARNGWPLPHLLLFWLSED